VSRPANVTQVTWQFRPATLPRMVKQSALFTGPQGLELHFFRVRALPRGKAGVLLCCHAHSSAISNLSVRPPGVVVVICASADPGCNPEVTNQPASATGQAQLISGRQ